MLRLLTVAAMALCIVPTAAQAAEKPCLTPSEFTALAEYGLPSIISGTAQRCNANLGPNAYLRRNGAELISRYSERKPASWPGAKAAFLKLSSSANADANSLIRNMPDPSLQQMLDSLMAGIIAQQVPLDRCVTIDRVISLLAPLPASNTAELIAVAVGIGVKSGHTKLGAINICQV